MLAQVRLLLHQMLARAHQIPFLFLGQFGDTDHREQPIDIEVRQRRRIDPIGLDLFAAGGGNTGRGTTLQ